MKPERRKFPRDYQCGAKKSYNTWNEANYAATRLRKKKGSYWDGSHSLAKAGGKGKLHVYKCKYCHYWHLGHNANKTGRRKG